MTTELEKRLLEQAQLPCCPFDRRSPDYYTTPNDQPCKVCGGLPEGPDRCTGADLRVMVEAATTIASLTAKLAEVEKERDHFYKQFDLAWEALTPRSTDETRGMERVLAILEAKKRRGTGPLRGTFGDKWLGRNQAFDECAAMLRHALSIENPLAALAGGGQATPGSGGTVDGGGCDL